MIDAMEEAVLQGGVPFLGICVGMQLMATRGIEFGTHDGLDWIPGEVRAIEVTDPADQGTAHGLERRAPDAAP